MKQNKKSIEPEKPNESSSLEPRFIEKLCNGDLGLCVTYWTWGVLAGPIWGITFYTILSTSHENLDWVDIEKILTFVKILFTIYYFFIYVGIWRAANKYNGNKIWATLAKFSIIITTLPIVIRILLATT